MSAGSLTVQTLQIAVTLALGIAGGWAASIIGLPLPWMLGSLILVTLLAVGGIKLADHAVHVPKWLRNCMVPVIGVMLGASFTPEIVARMAGWWLTLLALLVFIGVATFLVYHLYRRLFGFDPATAYFAAVPGGLIEMSIIGESAGGDGPRISLIHFCRIVLAVIIMAFLVQALHGPTASANVADLHPTGQLDLVDVAILLACAVGGYLGASAVRMPGAVVAGPLIASAAAHATGLTAAIPPPILVTIAQIVIGAALGSGFATLSFGALGKALSAAGAASIVLMTVTMSLSFAMLAIVDEPVAALILAYAPGGFAEMSLIALTLDIGVAFVAAHHVARIILSVLVMPSLWRYFLAPRHRAMPSLD